MNGLNGSASNHQTATSNQMANTSTQQVYQPQQLNVSQNINQQLNHNNISHANNHHHHHHPHHHHQQPQPQQQQQQQQQAPGPKPRGRRKKIRTEPIRPICPQCEKQFSNQSALTKHKLTHSDERKFACHQCSKAFKRHDHLTGHMQTHSNRKPYNCTIQGCDKTYCDARSLRRHKENIHHIVTPRENHNNNHHSNATNHINSKSNNINNNNNSNNNNHHNHHHMHNGLSPSDGTFATANVSATELHQHHATITTTTTDINNNNCNGDQQMANGFIHHHHHHNHLIGRSVSTNEQHQQQPLSNATNGIHLNYHQVNHQLQVSLAPTTAPDMNSSTDCPPPAQPPFSHLTDKSMVDSQTNMINDNNGLPTLGQRWPSNDLHGHHHLYSHHHPPHHHHQAPFSADYATTQQHHFSFDLNHIAPIEQSQQQVNDNGAIVQSHSAASLTDLSAISKTHDQQRITQSRTATTPQLHGGYLTPTTLHPPTPFSSSNDTQQMIYSQKQSNELTVQQQQQQQQQPSSTTLTNGGQQQQQSLYQRRIQRHHSDGSAYGSSDSDRIDPSRGPTHLACAADSSSQHQQQYQHASYSADYATNQHFDFDFNDNRDNNNDIIGGQTVGISTTMNTQHANSLTDLGSGNLDDTIKHEQQVVVAPQMSQQQEGGEQQQQHGGYITPTTLHPLSEQAPTYQSAPAETQTLVQSPSYSTTSTTPTTPANAQQQQPSHLLRRRIQRLHSAQSAYDGNDLDQAARLDLISRPVQLGCTATDQNLLQHQGSNNNNQYHTHQHQHASFSADYASTQHFNFDFNHMNSHHMDQPLGSNTIPLSADSITDSGLGLNMQFEQQMTPNSNQVL